MLTKICAEIFTSILSCLEQLVSEKCVVWGQYLCRMAMNTRFSFLTKFYSILFLVLGMGLRRWDREKALHIRWYLSTGKSPDFGDSWLSHANTALWRLHCQGHSAFTLKAGRMLSYLNEVTSKHPVKSKQEQATSWLLKISAKMRETKKSLSLESCATSLRFNKYTLRTERTHAVCELTPVSSMGVDAWAACLLFCLCDDYSPWLLAY